MRALMGEWVRWCNERSVRYLPAAPTTIAGWLLEHKEERHADIFAVLDCIALLHAMNGRADPTSTPIVRATLAHIMPEITAPRSWDATSKVAFHRLPADVQAVINRREHDRELFLRRRQNELAEKLKALTPDGEAVEQKEQVMAKRNELAEKLKQLKPDEPKEAVTTEKEKV
jgi:hypothetical protein